MHTKQQEKGKWKQGTTNNRNPNAEEGKSDCVYDEVLAL